jgi:three-Cys-motif partner protein
METLPTLADDGLVTPEVGGWGEDKYQLVRCYAGIFSRAMAGKWSSLIYVDFFAGAGRARLAGSHRIVPASPLLVLDVPKPFTKYIFCELDERNAESLRRRVDAHVPIRDARVVAGDTNETISDTVSLIPVGSLTFCFADPFRLENLHFTTVQTLAQKRRTDFLILLPSGMDANRNEVTYVKPHHQTVSNFTGQPDWRSRWPHPSLGFGDFVADEFGRAMAGLGYTYPGLPSTKVIVNNKNVPLYRLAFFSKHPLGAKFWEECRKYTDPQRFLFR